MKFQMEHGQLLHNKREHSLKKVISLIFMLMMLPACSNQVSDQSGITEKRILNEPELFLNSLIEESSKYEWRQLEDIDFKVVYNNFTIQDNTSSENIVNTLGYPEDYYDNNEGNISNGNGIRRWQLLYPDYQEPDLSISFLSKQKIDDNGVEHHGEGYIIGVYLQNTETARGLKVGDPKEEMFELYGRPTTIQKYNANVDFIEVIYTKDKNSLNIVLDKTVSTIKYIFIDYNMARSIEDQKIQ